MSVAWGQAEYDGAYVGQDGLPSYRATPRRLAGHALRAQALIPIMGLTAGSRLLVIGAGFGWTLEPIKAALPGIEIIGTDTSGYVNLKRNDGSGDFDSTSTHQNREFLNNGDWNKIKGDFTGDITQFFTEDVISGYDDVELQQFAGFDGKLPVACTRWHYVTPRTIGNTQPETDHPTWNWKTMAEWRALFDAIGLPDHNLIEAGNFGEVF